MVLLLLVYWPIFGCLLKGVKVGCFLLFLYLFSPLPYVTLFWLGSSLPCPAFVREENKPPFIRV